MVSGQHAHTGQHVQMLGLLHGVQSADAVCQEGGLAVLAENLHLTEGQSGVRQAALNAEVVAGVQLQRILEAVSIGAPADLLPLGAGLQSRIL